MNNRCSLRTILSLALVLAILSACAPVTQAAPTTAPTSTAAPTNVPASTDTPAVQGSRAFDGYWIGEVPNTIVAIHENQAVQYGLTQMSCVGPFFPQTLEQKGSDIYYLSMRLALSEDKLDLFPSGAPFRYSLSRIPDLPELCKKGDTLKTDDPVINFEVLWHTFQENYAFFKVKGIDWQAQYDQYRPQVKADMSQSELYALISDMLAPFQDSNVWLWSETLGDFVAYKDKPGWSANSVAQSLVMSEYAQYKLKMAGKDKLIYGKLNGSIGYLQIKSFSEFADSNVDADNLAAAQAAIDQVIQDLGDSKAMIVDLRFNGGGSDAIALAIASRFADQRRLALSTAFRKGDSFTEPYEIYLEPAGKSLFTRPVYLLTSNYTVGSGEVFVLAMRALPNVKTIGERTRGCSSIELYVLPNGWIAGVPDFEIIAADGKVYDGLGIPPDVEIAMDTYDPTVKKDAILDKALELAGAGK